MTIYSEIRTLDEHTSWSAVHLPAHEHPRQIYLHGVTKVPPPSEREQLRKSAKETPKTPDDDATERPHRSKTSNWSAEDPGTLEDVKEGLTMCQKDFRISWRGI